MWKRMWIMLLSAAVGGFVLGCSEEEAKDANEGVENVAEDPALQGNFTDQCTESDWLDVSEKKVLEFKGNQLEAHTVFYSDDNCKEEGARLVYNGEFQVDADALPEEESGTLNVKLEKAELRISSQTLADLLSAANFCDVDTFQPGQTVTLKGRTSDAFCPIEDLPGRFYGAYKVKDERLYLSADDLTSFARSESERNAQLDQDHPFFDK